MMSRRGQEGSALLVSTFIVMLAFLITMAVTTRATLTLGAVERALWESHAFNSAEAGLAIAVQSLVEEEEALDATWLPHGMAKYRIDIESKGRHGPWKRLQILSQGKCKSVHVVLEAKVFMRHHDEDFRPEIRLIEWQQLPPGSAP